MQDITRYSATYLLANAPNNARIYYPNKELANVIYR